MPNTLAIVNACKNPIAAVADPLTPLAGQTILAHTLAALQQAQRVDRLLVLCDDEQVVSECQQWGVESMVISQGSNRAVDLLHALEGVAATDSWQPQWLVAMDWLAPLVAAKDIDRTIDVLIEEQADTALAVVELDANIWACENSVGQPLDPQSGTARHQQYVVDAGSIHAMGVAGFRQHGQLYFGKTVVHRMPQHRALRLRSAADLEMATLELRRRQAAQRDSRLPRQIKAIVFDFDGVFTDNLVTLDQDGRESARCSRGDGMGIGQLKKTGIPLLVLSKEPVPIVVHRCQKLGLECLHGVDNKLPLLERWLAERDIPHEATIYMGNDINDRDCLAAMGCGVVPADAHPDVLPVASLVLDHAGGQGAVRQLCDLVCSRFAAAGH